MLHLLFHPPPLNAQGQLTTWNSASKDRTGLKVMNTQTNLAAVAEDLPLAEATYILAKDINYIPGLDAAEDLSDAVSMLPGNDDKFGHGSYVTSF
eukprot:7821466-Ditylum_brightwellii.AAC.1